MSAILVLAAALGVATVQAQTGESDLGAIKTRGVLRVLVARAVGQPIFGTAQDVQPGFDREILEGFARLNRLRVDPVFEPEWKGLIPALLAGKGDVIAGGFSDTPARRGQIAFTAEVFPTRVVVVNMTPNPVVTSLETLKKETVGAPLDSSLRETALRQGVPATKFKDVPGVIEFDLGALRSGEVSVVLADLHSALFAQKGDQRVQIGMFLGEPGCLAFGLRREDAGLRAALDEYLANLRRSGGWNRLVVKYWGDVALNILQRARKER